MKTQTVDLNSIAKQVHAANAKWWQNIDTGEPIKRNKGELLALIHSEISEGFDGEIDGLMDDKLPFREMAEVELVDAQIRIFDYAAGFGHDLNRAGLKFGVSNFIDLNHLGECASLSETVLGKIDNHGTAFIHSQISKVLEHERKGRTLEAEDALVECLLCISVYALNQAFDLQGAYEEKMAYNATRKDHTHEARKIAGGKQF